MRSPECSHARPLADQWVAEGGAVLSHALKHEP